MPTRPNPWNLLACASVVAMRFESMPVPPLYHWHLYTGELDPPISSTYQEVAESKTFGVTLGETDKHENLNSADKSNPDVIGNSFVNAKPHAEPTERGQIRTFGDTLLSHRRSKGRFVAHTVLFPRHRGPSKDLANE